uniref:Uncharacterized protein n=1 Tax=Dromaius novaehollandiae TaxID=8790 RepID=A0A8C4KM99_DRONO
FIVTESFSIASSFFSSKLGFSKVSKKKIEAEFQQLRDQLQGGYNPTIRIERSRLKSFLSYNSYSWSQTEMAAAGFYHMDVESSVQCFCCGLVLFRLHPMCEFVLGKEVGNISKYEEEAILQSVDGCLLYAGGKQPALLARVGFFSAAFFFSTQRL